MERDTAAVHVGVGKDETYNSVITPIYPTTTFRFDTVDTNRGYDYTRSGNPTRAALEESLASSGGRPLRVGGGFRHGCGDGGRDDAAQRRPPGGRSRHLWRYLPLVRVGAARVGDRLLLCRYGRHRRDPSGHPRGDADALDRDPVEPPAQPDRHRRGRRLGARPRPAHGRRQHLPHSLFPAPTGSGSRPGPALHHEVPERTQRRHRRGADDLAGGPLRTAGHSDQRSGVGAGPLRRLAGAARGEDPRAPYAGTRAERLRRRPLPGRASAGASGLLSRPRGTRWASAGETAADRLRGSGQLRCGDRCA